jgi:hypothetical protein
MDRDWIAKIGAHSLGPRLFAAKARKHPRYVPPRNIEHFQFAFSQWDGPIGPWEEHFGKGRGQEHSRDRGDPLRSCNEVEVAKVLRGIRQHAFWVSAFDTSRMPAIWRRWVLSMGELPPWLARLDTTIRALIRSKKGGMPDVVAWSDDDPLRSSLFVECKGAKEGFKEAQEDWVWAGLASKVADTQIAVSVRPF